MNNHAAFLLGVAVTILVEMVAAIIMTATTNEYVKDKLVVEYVNTETKFERKTVNDMVELSSIWTNFVNRDVTMDEHRIKWVFTNPKKR